MSGDAIARGDLRALRDDLTIGNPRKLHVLFQCPTCREVYFRTTLAMVRQADAACKTLHDQAARAHKAKHPLCVLEDE